MNANNAGAVVDEVMENQQWHAQESRWAVARQRLVQELKKQGIASDRVLAAMGQVKRHHFVPTPIKHRAYDNVALPIGLEQTISQPFIVALMSQLAKVKPDDRVLVVGTGSGYQDAVLACLVNEVYSIERIPELAQSAREKLRLLGHHNVQVSIGDGYGGLAKHAPFAAIVVTAAAPQVPTALLEQLEPGGRLVIPVGQSQQQLRVLVREPEGGIHDVDVVSVQFVPLVPGNPQPVV